MNGRGRIVRHAVDGDLLLLHRLEQRGLRLRRGPVDLVGEHDLGNDRPGAELEVAGLLVVDRDAGDIARQQIRGELDALEACSLRDRASDFAIIVLPTPGTSSIRTCPWPASATIVSSSSARFPTTTFSTLSRIACRISPGRRLIVSSLSARGTSCIFVRSRRDKDHCDQPSCRPSRAVSRPPRRDSSSSAGARCAGGSRVRTT